MNKNISSATITGNELVATCESGCFIDDENPVNSFKVILPNITIDKIDEWNETLSDDVVIKIQQITPGVMDYFFNFHPGF